MELSSSNESVFDAIEQEHNALRAKVDRIHNVLYGPDPTSEEIAALLRDFQNALMVHFSNEEAEEGFFEDVTFSCPQLSQAALRLCAEHREMLQKADELCRFATAGSPSVVWLHDLRSRCHEFTKQLMHHESEENRLLQQAHQVDIGTVD